ncbi:MFS transporter [Massilia sp. TWR1-2-2]|uniref:MFS transporter n=1 Tax=Massilia sp. TWR1-2-2 TaxID=2804584 RepID=UPI003CF2FA04
MHSRASNIKIIALLAVPQVIAWGTLYYAFAVLAADIGRELGWRAETVFGAFSWSLLVGGLVAAPAGMLLDRLGGRVVMAAGSLLCGIGFIMLSRAHTLLAYYLAWTVLGAAMAATLYEAAFATLNHHFGVAARQAISTLTLFAGFASTIFWPLTLHVNTAIGWRDTYLLYAALQLGLCLPLHVLLGPTAPAAARPQSNQGAPDFTLRQALRHSTFWSLAFAFSANSFIFSALSVHLIPILQRLGHPLGTVVFMAALIGPMQVAARIVERAFAARSRPQTVGKVAFGALPAGLLALLFFGTHQTALALFCVCYGASNGILTIARGTVPQVLFGPRNYGAISGAMSAPAMLSKAAGPLAVAAVIEWNSSPAVLFGLLFAFAIASLLFYLMAVRSDVPATATQLS